MKISWILYLVSFASGNDINVTPQTLQSYPINIFLFFL